MSALKSQNLLKHTKINAKYIPQLLKNRLYIIILLIFLLPLPPFMTVSKAGTRVFYARIDIKYSDGRIKKSNFLMVPAENDFRAANFTSVFITGTADFSHSVSEVSIETQAKHNAIKCLLEQRGLKSIKSKSTTVNNLQHTEFVLSYEGSVKLPLKIIKKKIDKQNNLCAIALEIEFAPIAFPDKWPILKFKYKIKQIFNNFISLFK